MPSRIDAVQNRNYCSIDKEKEYEGQTPGPTSTCGTKATHPCCARQTGTPWCAQDRRALRHPGRALKSNPDICDFFRLKVRRLVLAWRHETLDVGFAGGLFQSLRGECP